MKQSKRYTYAKFKLMTSLSTFYRRLSLLPEHTDFGCCCEVVHNKVFMHAKWKFLDVWTVAILMTFYRGFCMRQPSCNWNVFSIHEIIFCSEILVHNEGLMHATIFLCDRTATIIITFNLIKIRSPHLLIQFCSCLANPTQRPSKNKIKEQVQRSNAN